jgi:hypothetical protein
MRRFVTGLLILVSAVCLFASSTSLWVRHNVINTGVFVSNVETIVDLPQVEARINQRVTETVMTTPQVTDAIDGVVAALPPRLQQFKPTVTTGVQSVVSAGVGRLLTNDPFRPLTRAAITSAHDQLVAGQPVRFTLGQAKNLVPASARDGLADQVLDLVPNNLGVTLVTPADAPRLYNAVDLLKSVWWWVGLIAVAALAGALGISRRRRGTLRAWAGTTAVLGLVALIALRVARGQIVVQAKPANRDALGAIYDVLAGSLRSWTLWLIAVALVVLVLALVWGRLGIVAGIRRGAAAARAQVQRRREARQSAAETAAGAAPTEDGAAAPAAGESWPRRVAADTRAFVQGLEVDRRAAVLGAFVAAHFRTARWAGIVLAVVILLAWPSPTLSVLIWIGALVALYIGALDWLRSKAPAAAAVQAAAEGIAAAEERAVEQPAVDGGPRTAQPLLPVPRPPAEGAPAPALVPAGPDGVPAGAGQQPVAAPSPMAALEGRVLSPEVLSSLGGRLDLLVRLRQAHEAGVLTDDEFDREKGRLLGV